MEKQDRVISGIWQIRRLSLCIPPILLFILDITLTLLGQPEEYWAGNYDMARERSPEVRRVMQTDPVLLFVMIAVWIGVIVFLIRVLPQTLAELFSVATTVAHTAAASSWLRIFVEHSYQLKIAISIVSGCLIVFSLRANKRESSAETGTATRTTWCLAVLLLIAIAYAVLYPH